MSETVAEDSATVPGVPAPETTAKSESEQKFTETTTESKPEEMSTDTTGNPEAEPSDADSKTENEPKEEHSVETPASSPLSPLSQPLSPLSSLSSPAGSIPGSPSSPNRETVSHTRVYTSSESESGSDSEPPADTSGPRRLSVKPPAFTPANKRPASMMSHADTTTSGHSTDYNSATPATPGHLDAVDVSQTGISGHMMHDDTPNGNKRPRILVACDGCRQRKVRCDGSQPTCSRCIKRGVTCTYTSRKAVRALAAAAGHGFSPINAQQPPSSAVSVNGRSLAKPTYSPVASEAAPVSPAAIPATETPVANPTAPPTAAAVAAAATMSAMSHQTSVGNSAATSAAAASASAALAAAGITATPGVAPASTPASASAAIFGMAPRPSMEKLLLMQQLRKLVNTSPKAGVNLKRSVYRMTRGKGFNQNKFLWSLPPRGVADPYINAYLDNLHGYLPIIYKPSFLSAYTDVWLSSAHPASPGSPAPLLTAPLKKKNEKIEKDEEDDLFYCILNLILALGAFISEPAPDATAKASPFFLLATRLLDYELMNKQRAPSLLLVQALSLAAQYLFITNDNREEALTYIQLAISKSVALGLHLASNGLTATGKAIIVSHVEQMFATILWCTVTNLGKLISGFYGRPVFISESADVSAATLAKLGYKLDLTGNAAGGQSHVVMKRFADLIDAVNHDINYLQEKEYYSKDMGYFCQLIMKYEPQFAELEQLAKNSVAHVAQRQNIVYMMQSFKLYLYRPIFLSRMAHRRGISLGIPAPLLAACIKIAVTTCMALIPENAAQEFNFLVVPWLSVHNAYVGSGLILATFLALADHELYRPLTTELDLLQLADAWDDAMVHINNVATEFAAVTTQTNYNLDSQFMMKREPVGCASCGTFYAARCLQILALVNTAIMTYLSKKKTAGPSSGVSTTAAAETGYEDITETEGDLDEDKDRRGGAEPISSLSADCINVSDLKELFDPKSGWKQDSSFEVLVQLVQEMNSSYNCEGFQFFNNLLFY